MLIHPQENGLHGHLSGPDLAALYQNAADRGIGQSALGCICEAEDFTARKLYPARALHMHEKGIRPGLEPNDLQVLASQGSLLDFTTGGIRLGRTVAQAAVAEASPFLDPSIKRHEVGRPCIDGHRKFVVTIEVAKNFRFEISGEKP